MESFLARFYNRPIGESATVWVGRLFGCVRKLPDELLFFPVLNAVWVAANEYSTWPGRQRQYSPSLELPSG